MEQYWHDERTRRRMLAVPIAYFIFYVICFALLEEYVRPLMDTDRVNMFGSLTWPGSPWCPVCSGTFTSGSRRAFST